MASHTTINVSRRSGQDAPRRHTPSKLSEDERWVLEQSGWANFEWDVEPEDEKAMAEGRLPSGAFMPPKLLVESAPLLQEEDRSDEIDFHALFGDDNGDADAEKNSNGLFDFIEDELPVLGEDLFKLLEQQIRQELVATNELEHHHTPANPAPNRILTPAPTNAVTSSPRMTQAPTSLAPPSVQRSRPFSRNASPGPSSLRRHPYTRHAKNRRIHNLQAYFLTPDLSPSGSSVYSDGESDPEHEVGSSFNVPTRSIPILRLPECSPTPVARPNLYSTDFSLPFVNGYANMTGTSTQMFHPALVQQPVAGPSSLRPMMPISQTPQFSLADFDQSLLGFDLNTGIPIKQRSALGPDRKAIPTFRSASAIPYSRKTDSATRRLKRNAQTRRNILNDPFMEDDEPELKCQMCNYVQKRGAGDNRSFKRHLETHPENKSVEWRCRGSRGVDGEYRGGCGKCFARKDALQRHVKTSKGACVSDCVPLLINSEPAVRLSASQIPDPLVNLMPRPSSAPIMHWPQDTFQF